MEEDLAASMFEGYRKRNRSEEDDQENRANDVDQPLGCEVADMWESRGWEDVSLF